MSRSRDFSKQGGLPNLSFLTDAQRFDRLMAADAASRANQQSAISMAREMDRQEDRALRISREDVAYNRAEEAFRRQEEDRLVQEQNEAIFDEDFQSMQWSEDPNEYAEQVADFNQKYIDEAATSKAIKQQLDMVNVNANAVMAQDKAQKSIITRTNDAYSRSITPTLSLADKARFNRQVAEFQKQGVEIPAEVLDEYQGLGVDGMILDLSSDVDFADASVDFETTLGGRVSVSPRRLMSALQNDNDDLDGILTPALKDQLKKSSEKEAMRWLISGGNPLDNASVSAGLSKIGNSMKFAKGSRALIQNMKKLELDELKAKPAYRRLTNSIENGIDGFAKSFVKLQAVMEKEGLVIPAIDYRDEESFKEVKSQVLATIDSAKELTATQIESARTLLQSLEGSIYRIKVDDVNLNKMLPPYLREDGGAGGTSIGDITPE